MRAPCSSRLCRRQGRTGEDKLWEAPESFTSQIFVPWSFIERYLYQIVLPKQMFDKSKVGTKWVRILYLNKDFHFWILHLQSNVWFKKTGTIRSSNTLLRIVPIFFESEITQYSEKYWCLLCKDSNLFSIPCTSTSTLMNSKVGVVVLKTVVSLDPWFRLLRHIRLLLSNKVLKPVHKLRQRALNRW